MQNISGHLLPGATRVATGFMQGSRLLLALFACSIFKYLSIPYFPFFIKRKKKIDLQIFPPRQTPCPMSYEGMGVRGLAEILADFVGETPWRALSAGTRVLIDGSGWAFHLLNAPALGDAVERHHGGDYQELDARVEAAIGELRAARLVPEVWWDGPRTRMKARTMRKRMVGRLESEGWALRRRSHRCGRSFSPATAIVHSIHKGCPEKA